MEKTEDILWWVLFGGLLLTACFPLLADYGKILFPLGRDIILRMLVEALFFFYLLLLYFDSSFRPRTSPLLFALLGFLVVSGLATLFSSQPLFSLFGNPFRGHGFISQVHLFFFFLLLVSIFEEKDLWDILLWVAVSVSLVVSSISVVEVLSGSWRVQSTLNNPNFFAAYLLLTCFITLLLLFRQEDPFLLKGKGKGKKLFLILVFVLQFFGIVHSRSRGAWLGFGAGLGAFVLFYLAPRLLDTRRKRVAAVGLGLLILGAGAFFSRQKGLFSLLWKAITAPIPEIEGRGRSIRQRAESYRTALLGIRERPVLGWGPENFVVAFDRFYSGVLESTHYPWFDKVHNVFLEVGVTTGLLGLLSYLLLWFFAFRPLFFSEGERALKAGLFATFVAYLTQNMFNIDTTTSFVYIHLFWGLSHFLWTKKKEQKS